MSLQKVFTPSYVQFLRNHINVEDYLQDSFPFDCSEVRSLNGVKHDETLLQKLDPTPDGDFQTGIALFEAFPNLSPVFAQQDDLWVYLTHVDLFQYVKQRWPIKEHIVDDIGSTKNYILNHWHKNPKHLFRTTLCGLWWQVYLTVDKTLANPYELTEVFFNCGQDFHQRFGELLTIRHREAMYGILRFLQKHPDLTQKNFDPRGQYISQLFNLIGGTKVLSSMDRSFFMNELEKRYDYIKSIQNRDEVQNQEIK